MINEIQGFKIIVKNIPWSVTWQQLKDAFKEYGAVRADVAQDDKVDLNHVAHN